MSTNPKKEYPYDYVVYIGRMEPPTKAHCANVIQALNIAKKVIVLFGSSYQPRTFKNPWKSIERATMLFNQLPFETHPRILTGSLRDYRYNDEKWILQVQKIVRKLSIGTESPKIGIIGCKKDHTSYYLELFPQWKYIDVPEITDISATDIRQQYFEGTLFSRSDKDFISQDLKDYLRKWANTEEYANLKAEYDHTKAYKKSWENTPYPVTFVTSDAVVLQAGHVLLVQRRFTPGKGLWALPGGFVNQYEFIFKSCLRELREETGLKVPEPVLQGSVIGERVFDNPGRSLRGRTITHAYAFKLQQNILSKVKGSVDAAKAKWFPIDEVMENMEEFLFEDHRDIIEWAVDQLQRTHGGNIQD
ncbi:MAG: bifunctional nicotinamide-nucleotide adenylyltransferase/Nudix hydroxylase [Candidatus Nitrosotenuis sp.]